MFLVMIAAIYGTISASKKMYNDLLDNVLRSPMSFFDMTPVGRLLNRFSKDVDTMDADLRMQIQQWIIYVSNILSSLIIITYSTPIFISVVIPLIIIFAIIQVTNFKFKPNFLVLTHDSIQWENCSSCRVNKIHSITMDITIAIVVASGHLVGPFFAVNFCPLRIK